MVDAETLRSIICSSIQEFMQTPKSEPPHPKPSTLNREQLAKHVENLKKAQIKLDNCTYSLQKYHVFQNITGADPRKEIQELTNKYITNTLEQVPTIESISKYAEEALQHAIDNLINQCTFAKQSIKYNKNAINAHEDLNGTPNTLAEQTIKQAHKETVKTQKMCYNTIHEHASFYQTRNLYDHIRKLANETGELSKFTEYTDKFIKIKDQAINTMTKYLTTQKHLTDNTTPKYLKEHNLPWKGPHLTQQMKEIWEEAHQKTNKIYLKATIKMLDAQIQQILDEFDQLTKTYETTLLTKHKTQAKYINNYIEHVALIRAIRTSRDYNTNWTLNNEFTEIMNKKLGEPFKPLYKLFKVQENTIEALYTQKNPQISCEITEEENQDPDITILANINTNALPQRKRSQPQATPNNTKKPKMNE